MTHIRDTKSLYLSEMCTCTSNPQICTCTSNPHCISRSQMNTRDIRRPAIGNLANDTDSAHLHPNAFNRFSNRENRSSSSLVTRRTKFGGKKERRNSGKRV